MLGRKVFRTVRRYVSAVAAVATAAALVFTIYFTRLDLQWVAFLTGILVAAILAVVTRASHAEWVVARRSAQLSSAKDKLERETHLRKEAEDAMAATRPRLHLIDEVISDMVALVDADGRYRYHNRAFRDYLGLRPEQVDGRHVRDVLGAKVFAEIAAAVRQSLAGHAVTYEREQTMLDGAVRRLSVAHVSQFGEDGKVTGFYVLARDVTEPGGTRASIRPGLSASLAAGPGVPAAGSAQAAAVGSDRLPEVVTEDSIGEEDAGTRILAAIEKDEFRLYCQLIAPLVPDSGDAEHYEILLRLMEEEENMMPPGAFFSIAEKYGLMTHLDRWVVQHLLEWVSSHDLHAARGGSMFFVNLAWDTIGSVEFPEFVQSRLQKYEVTGSTLCFEITDSGAALDRVALSRFVRQVRQYGCRVALSGFGRSRDSFELLRGLQVDVLKIDGGMILDVLRDPADLAKVTAIGRIAKTIGVKTVAEFVESEEIVAKLQELGVDFAQGFGISRPLPLEEIGSLRETGAQS